MKKAELGTPVLHNHPLTQLNMPVASSRQRRTDGYVVGGAAAGRASDGRQHEPHAAEQRREREREGKMKLPPPPLNVFDSKRGKERRCRFQSEFPREIVSTQFASCVA